MNKLIGKRNHKSLLISCFFDTWHGGFNSVYTSSEKNVKDGFEDMFSSMFTMMSAMYSNTRYIKLISVRGYYIIPSVDVVVLFIILMT